MTSFALLIDGGFMLKRLRHIRRGPAGTRDVLAECARIRRSGPLADLDMLRTYFYDAPPSMETLVNPVDGSRFDLSRTPQYAEARRLHDELELQPDFALRMGVLDCHGYSMQARDIADVMTRGGTIRAGDVRPALVQKGVDLRLGLDIARLALRRLVDTVVIVTGDSDMVPAFKFARREGLRVVLDHLGAPVKRELKAHVDLVLG